MTTYRMPPEWDTHKCTWMAWPSSGYTLGNSDEAKDEARRTWAAVANAIIDFEPVRMLCEPADMQVARQYLNDLVELIPAELDDAWMRDIGPTFVRDDHGNLAGVNWVFNGWGAQPWAAWGKDSKVATFISSQSQTPIVDSWLVNEGGGIHVNGKGTVLLTETVQLGEGRNPKASKAEVEAEIHRLLGTDNAIWIKRGLTRDYDDFGTRGHIDIVACFADAETILFHDQQDPAHPDYLVSAEVKATLEAAGTSRLIAVPAPKVLSDDEGWVDYSYINHYIVNGGVIMCSFGDENDAAARSILEKVYPGRTVVAVDARPLFARGGGIHCITQQQPL